ASPKRNRRAAAPESAALCGLCPHPAETSRFILIFVQPSALVRGCHFPHQKKVAKESAALGFHSSNTPVGPEVRASLSLPRESDKERPGSPPDPRAGRQPSSGGCRPGLPLDSRPNPGLHWPPGRIGAPWAVGPGRGAGAAAAEVFAPRSGAKAARPPSL